MLKDEKSGIDMAGATLPSLKMLLENPPGKTQPAELAKYGRLIHGLLSACVVNIDEMQSVSLAVCPKSRFLTTVRF